MQLSVPKTFKAKTALLLWLMLAAAPAFARPLSRRQIETDVTTIAGLVAQKYVDEARGKEIALHLQQQYKQGFFDGVKDQKAFDSLLTYTLRAFGRDGHLFVKSNREIVQNIKAEATDTKHPAPDLFFYGPEAETVNFGFKEVKILDSNIGYLKLSEINISGKSLPVLQAAMELLQRSRALIIDLRDNGGGGSDTGAVLESYFLPPATALLEIKSRSGSRELMSTVPWLKAPRYTNTIYILVNKKTASAAEAFAYVLQAQGRATVIGQVTAGACNMNTYFAVNDDRYVSISTQAPSLPGNGDSWEQKGIRPDAIVPEQEALSYAIRHILKEE